MSERRPALFSARRNREANSGSRDLLTAIPVWKFRATVLRVHEGSQEIDIDILRNEERHA
jgi:hypothetical protein